jgi:hypothetical protein
MPVLIEVVQLRPTAATVMLLEPEPSGPAFFSWPGASAAAAKVARDKTSINAANVLVTGDLLLDSRLCESPMWLDISTKMTRIPKEESTA